MTHRVEENREELRGRREMSSERAGPGRHPSEHLLQLSLSLQLEAGGGGRLTRGLAHPGTLFNSITGDTEGGGAK